MFQFSTPPHIILMISKTISLIKENFEKYFNNIKTAAAGIISKYN